MPEQPTKRDAILDAALTLFSEKGYDGVGVDEIAHAIGMKGPALYHYFKGKEAILEALIETNEARYNTNFVKTNPEKNLPDTMEAFAEQTTARLTFTLHDDHIRKMRRMLAMEQFRNDRIRALTTAHHLTRVEEINRILIQHLQEKGQLKPYDPKLLAFAFTAPISMMVQWVDREPEKEAEAMERIRAHMAHFAEVYGVKQEQSEELT